MQEEENPDVPKGFSSLLTGTVFPVLLFLAFVWIGVKFLIPAVDYKELSEVKTVSIDQIQAGVNTAWRRDYDFFLVKEEHAIFALSARDKYAEKLIHQKALISWVPDRSQFVEQTWGSLYDLKGNAVGGPATWALDRLAVHLNEVREIIVDPKNVQNMDGEVRHLGNSYIVDETLRRVEHFVIKIP
ncbi:MAG: hypothetical protein HYR80_10330 [Nitrospirae bacterium]|nr:hypothetical protein [Nitrospirota bacterium]